MSILTRFRSLQSRAGRRRAIVACSVLASLSVCSGAAAQFGPIIELPPDLPSVQPLPPPEGYPPTAALTAVGTYFAPPAWSPTLAVNVRFVILSNLNSDAVLDRETGLVWARQSLSRTLPPLTQINKENVEEFCRRLTIGNRMGWRLPTIAELQSLVDRSRIFQNAPRPPALPFGHPFVLSRDGTNPTNSYWTAEAFSVFNGFNVGLHRRVVDLSTAQPRGLGLLYGPTRTDLDALCVRGGAAAVPDVAG